MGLLKASAQLGRGLLRDLLDVKDRASRHEALRRSRGPGLDFPGPGSLAL